LGKKMKQSDGEKKEKEKVDKNKIRLNTAGGSI
jgi:hypothetical protein